MFPVTDGIADEAFGIDHDAAGDGMFEDTGLVALARKPFSGAAADGEDFHGFSDSSVIPFSFHIS